MQHSDLTLLTEEELAQRLKVSTRTLRNERKEGRLAFVRIRGAIRYAPEDVIEYLKG